MFRDALEGESPAQGINPQFCCSRSLRRRHPSPAREATIEQILFTRFLSCSISERAAVVSDRSDLVKLALLFLCAKLPVKSVYKMMSVSSKSQMKTRSSAFSGDGDGFGALRPRPRLDFGGPVNWKHTRCLALGAR